MSIAQAGAKFGARAEFHAYEIPEVGVEVSLLLMRARAPE